MRTYWNYDGEKETANKKPHLASPSWIAMNERVRLQYSTQLFFLSPSILISRSRSWFQNISLVHFEAFRSMRCFFFIQLYVFFLVEFFASSFLPLSALISRSRAKIRFFTVLPTPKYIPSTMFFSWFCFVPWCTFVLRGADNEPYYTPAIVKLRWRKAVDEK